MADEKERVTKTRRFHRWWKKVTDISKLNKKMIDWECLNFIHSTKPYAKQAYEMGYEQGVRDAKRGLR